MPDLIESRSAYGHDQTPPCTGGYVDALVLRICRRIGAGKILDVGCGNGTLCRKLAAAGFAVVGLESSRTGVEAARRSVPAGTFHEMSVYDDPRAMVEAGFDAVVSTEVIEHLFLPRTLLEWAGAKLKPGGFLVLSTPYHGYFKNLLLSLVDGWDRHFSPGWDGGHVKFWSRRTLTDLLESNGFQVLEFHGAGRVPWLWKSMVLVAQKASGARP
ncbi:MAG: class I SAM-dependent methyltransferase [Kiritimatiellia bacterium]